MRVILRKRIITPSEGRAFVDHMDGSRSAIECSLETVSRFFSFDVPFPNSRGNPAGKRRRFGSFLPLPSERGIHALQGVAACCQGTALDRVPSHRLRGTPAGDPWHMPRLIMTDVCLLQAL